MFGEREFKSQCPCHVAHFVSTFAIKTDTKWLVQLARHTDRDAFRLSAVCFYDGGPVQEQLEALGVHTVNLNVRGERDPRALLRARKFLDELRPDIVHTHLLRADLIGGAAARWAGVPVIVSTVYAMGEFRREKRRRSDRFLDAACARLTSHTIAVSQAVAEDLIERKLVDQEDISIIHTGVETPPAVEPSHRMKLRRGLGVADDAPLILTVARLSYEKGLDTLIDAMAILHPAHRQMRFVIVGEGKDRARLSERIEQLGLGGVVNLVGFMPDVWPTLAAADVVCEWLRGKSVTDLHGLDDLSQVVFGSLDEFPADRLQCASIVFDALRKAMATYRERRVQEFRGEEALICTCFGVSEETIVDVIAANNVNEVEEVSAICRAGSGCGSCRMLIQEIIDAHA